MRGVSHFAFLSALLMCVNVAYGQIIEFSGGASTAYGAEGGGVHIRGQKMETTLGFGYVQGTFAAGGALIRKLPGGTLTLGQQELHMDLPTDVFDNAHFLFATGIGITRVSRDSSMQGFIGYASQEGGTPLFRAATLGKPTQYFQWVRPVSSECNLATTELLGAASAALVSTECKVTPDLTLAASAGVGGGSPYLAVSAVLKRRTFRLRASYSYANDHFQRGNNPFQPTPEPIRENVMLERQISRRFTFSASHGNFLTPPGELGQTGAFTTTAIRSNLDSAALQFQQRQYGAGVSLIRSGYDAGAAASSQGLLVTKASNAALTATFRFTRQRWQFSQVLLHSLQNTVTNTQTTILTNTLGVSVSPRLRLSESVNFSNGGTTFSHGGVFLTRYSSFEVDYQFFYVANRPDQPFQQGLLFNAELQLPDQFTLHASSTLDAVGRPLYTIQLGRYLIRGHATGALLETSFGECMIHGRVVDDHDDPVEGAALMLGEHRLYTDSDGYFQYRERRPATHALQILISEFTGMGEFTVISAPQTVRSARLSDSAPVRIVVAQHAPTQVASSVVAR